MLQVQVDALLNESLGLNSAQITLRSNVSADWHVDGTKIGAGKELSRSLPLARHSIIAAFGSKRQSTIENIQGNRVLQYSFKRRVPSARATVRKDSAIGCGDDDI
ncbi:MAG: hypothetical protein HOI95_09975 [Chromatiales bacterium]|nr:hypothetical protein [Chromatiales bacterium]